MIAFFVILVGFALVVFALAMVKTLLDKKQKFSIQAESVKIDEEMGEIIN